MEKTNKAIKLIYQLIKNTVLYTATIIALWGLIVKPSLNNLLSSFGALGFLTSFSSLNSEKKAIHDQFVMIEQCSGNDTKAILEIAMTISFLIMMLTYSFVQYYNVQLFHHLMIRYAVAFSVYLKCVVPFIVANMFSFFRILIEYGDFLEKESK